LISNKMYKVICYNCLSEVTFSDPKSMPKECPYCFETIDASVPVTEIPITTGIVDSLTLIYQINQQKIIVLPAGITFLGRENTGAETLKNILCNEKPVVSRKHCSIEFKDNKFFLKDENSLNGTFYGVNKINCNNNPQLIENNSMIFLGQEAFLAIIKYKVTAPITQTTDSTQASSNEKKEDGKETLTIKKRYRCKDCGAEFDTWSQECPKCETYNGLVEI
jgi:pSer/pThr/pTyr-binding forkhead associated (FHA) protein